MTDTILTKLICDAVSRIGSIGEDESAHHYGIRCGKAAAEAVLKHQEDALKGNGWKMELHDSQYAYLSFEGKPGVIQLKADDEGFVVDAFKGNTEGESVSSLWVEYSDLEVTYDFDVASYAKQGAETISDIRLAFRLGYKHRNETTEHLLSTTINGEEYSLRLCGCLHVTSDAEEDRSVFGDELTEAIIDGFESKGEDSKFSLDSAPWFEWINNAGDPVGDIIDEINLDPNVEIKKLNDLIAKADVDNEASAGGITASAKLIFVSDCV